MELFKDNIITLEIENGLYHLITPQEETPQPTTTTTTKPKIDTPIKV